MTVGTSLDQAAAESLDALLDHIVKAAETERLNQNQLAALAELNPDTVNRCLYLRNRRPGSAILFKLCLALGVVLPVRETPSGTIAAQIREKLKSLPVGLPFSLRGVTDPISGGDVSPGRVRTAVFHHTDRQGWTIKTLIEDGAVVVLRES